MTTSHFSLLRRAQLTWAQLRGQLTVSGMRRWVLYQPLAIILSILMLPELSWLDHGPGVHPFQASAQVNGFCTPSPSNAIIRADCPSIEPIANFGGDLYQLEQDAVNAYLAQHALPAADSQIVYKYGREDLRNAIRGNMVSILVGIAAKSPSVRTSHEQNLYTWFQKLVQQNEIALYTSAQNEYNRWVNDPCTFTLDPTIAQANSLSYDGSPFCFGTLSSLLSAPPVPAASYYQAFGIKSSYGLPVNTYSNFPSLVAGSAAYLGEVAGIASAASAVVIGAAAAALVASLSASLAAFNAAVATTGVITSAATTFASTASAAFVVTGSTVAELGVISVAAGPITMILIAAACGVAALMSLLNNQANATATANFLANLSQAQTVPPDLNAFANDSSGNGMYKIQTTLVAQTVPEMASTAQLPTHRASDLSFAITPSQGGTASIDGTFTYEDWNGVTWSAETSGGWFVQTCTSPAANCPQTNSMIADIRFVDWSGVNWSAGRLGNTFSITKASPASSDIVCPADTITGLSPSVSSSCASYVANTIPLTDASGNHVTVGLSVLSAPVFTSAAAMSFSQGTASTQTVTAVGNPTPMICLSGGGLTGGFTLNGGGGCGTGSYTVSFDGDSKAPTQNYNLTFTASNHIGTMATQHVTVDVSQQLNIISPASFSGTAGFPVNFTVVATGIPTPTLSAGTESLLGLNFTDNGNGTATISGTVAFGQSNFCIQPCTGVGITATNSQGTVSQWIQIDMASAPPAVFLPPTSATFFAGAANQIVLNSGGAITPVTWHFQGDSNAPWLSLKDNGNGTALLEGTPPLGTTGTFNPQIGPGAAGILTLLTPFPVTVENTPVFTSSNTATFTVGTQSTFDILSSQGTVATSDSMPQGLAFSSGSPATIGGTPAVGSGGQYSINLTSSSTSGAGTQDLILNVNEATSITSPNLVTLFAGQPAAFNVSTVGYPSLSQHPVAANSAPPTDPTQGDGTYFAVTGLPQSLQATHQNLLGEATGTLTISGTPQSGDIGTHKVQITAQNGVGTPAQQTLTLQIYPYSTSAAVNLISSFVLSRDASHDVVATVVVANNGTVAAKDVAIKSAKIGSVAGNISPAAVASVGPASTATFTIVFPAASVGASGTPGSLILAGAYTGGTFSSGGRIVLP